MWAYSISAVKQDTFEDLDEEARELLAARMKDERIRSGEEGSAAAATTSVSSSVSSSSDAGLAKTVISTAAPSPDADSLRTNGPANVSDDSQPKGVLAAQLHRHLPRALDPASKTLVWGAPPVDRIGRLGDKNDRPS